MSKLRDVMQVVQDVLVEGVIDELDERTLPALETAYGAALNGSKCPCESGKKFSDCCKQEWNALKRGIEAAKRESHEAKKAEARGDKPQPGEKCEWLCKVGIDEKDGSPAVKPIGDAPMSPYSIAGLLLAAYHRVMTETNIDMINGACNKLASQLGARPAGQGKPKLVAR